MVGHFSGSDSLAAVGSTTFLINILVNFFIGFSIGVNVLVGRYCGAKEKQNVLDTIHTSVLFSLVSGLFLAAAGQFVSAPLLRLSGVPEEILPQAALYMKIYFAGSPAILLYNFCAAILRAGGDTKRPLYSLFAAGILNVILNLVFVIGFGMAIGGVALATVLSQVLSAVLVVRRLMRSEYRLDPRSLRIHWQKLKEIIGLGLPAGLQNVLFSFSNALIQSSINSFGSVAIAGSTAAMNLDSFLFAATNAVSQAALTFISQNMGARRYDRLNRVLGVGLGLGVAFSLLIGIPMTVFGEQLMRIYTTDPAVIESGMIRVVMVFPPYFLCSIMYILASAIRGMGHSTAPMIVSVVGVCGIRVLWVFLVFPAFPTLQVLYLSYICTWIPTITAHLICYFHYRRELKAA